MAVQPLVGQALLTVEASRLYSDTHSRWDSSGGVVGLSQKPVPDNTQHSQETDVIAPRVIRTRSPTKREAADPRLRPRGHWDRFLKH